MHGLQTLSRDRRCRIAESHSSCAGRVTDGGRSYPVHCEITCLQCSGIYRITNVDRERGRLAKDNTTSCRNCARDDQTAASRELEAADAGAPIERGGTGRIILVGVPEGAVIDWINSQVTVISPTIHRATLAAYAGEERRFTLSQSIRGIARQASGIAYSGHDCGARHAEANRQVAVVIHCRAAHPAPRCVWLISTLLKFRYRSVGDIAQFEPAHSGNAVGADGVITHHRFMVAKVAIREPKHQTVTDSIHKVTVRFGHTSASRRTKFCETCGRNSREQRER